MRVPEPSFRITWQLAMPLCRQDTCGCLFLRFACWTDHNIHVLIECVQKTEQPFQRKAAKPAASINERSAQWGRFLSQFNHCLNHSAAWIKPARKLRNHLVKPAAMGDPRCCVYLAIFHQSNDPL